MSSRCRSRRSSFARPACDRETLAAHSFFLRYHGHGLTKADIDRMSFDQMQQEVKRLNDQINAEKEARERAIRDAKSRRK